MACYYFLYIKKNWYIYEHAFFSVQNGMSDEISVSEGHPEEEIQDAVS